MLIPKEEGEKLICPDCGKEEKLQSKEDYKLQEEAGGKKAPGIAVVEEERKKSLKNRNMISTRMLAPNSLKKAIDFSLEKLFYRG